MIRNVKAMFAIALFGTLLTGGAMSTTSAQTPLAGTPLKQAADSLSPGEFTPLESRVPAGFKKFQDLVRVPRHRGGSDGRLEILSWTDAGQWDPQRHKAFFMGLRRTKRFIVYDAPTNTWDVIPIQGEQAPPSFEPYGHMYGRTALDWQRGHYYHLSGSTLYRYHIDQDRWEELPDTPLHHNISMDWHYGLDRLVAVQGAGGGGTHFTAHGLRGQEWTRLGDTTVHGYHSTAQYNPIKNTMLAAGGTHSRRAVNLIHADGRIETLNDAPFEITISNSILTYDPQSGHYLILRGRSLFEHDPKTDQWHEAATWDNHEWPFGRHGHIVPIPIDELGVILWLTDRVTPQLYRHDSVIPEHSGTHDRIDVSPITAQPEPLVSAGPVRDIPHPRRRPH